MKIKKEIIIGNILRSGVILAGAVTLAGGALYIARYYGTAVNYRTFIGAEAGLRSVGGILRAALSLDPKALIQTGVLILIATPVVRVLFSVFYFAEEHDNTYVAITLIVLAVLMYSLSGGHIWF